MPYQLFGVAAGDECSRLNGWRANKHNGILLTRYLMRHYIIITSSLLHTATDIDTVGPDVVQVVKQVMTGSFAVAPPQRSSYLCQGHPGGVWLQEQLSRCLAKVVDN